MATRKLTSTETFALLESERLGVGGKLIETLPDAKDSKQQNRDKIYFAAGRYAAGHRDNVAVRAWLAIGEVIIEKEK